MSKLDSEKPSRHTPVPIVVLPGVTDDLFNGRRYAYDPASLLLMREQELAEGYSDWDELGDHYRRKTGFHVQSQTSGAPQDRLNVLFQPAVSVWQAYETISWVIDVFVDRAAEAHLLDILASGNSLERPDLRDCRDHTEINQALFVYATGATPEVFRDIGYLMAGIWLAIV